MILTVFETKLALIGATVGILVAALLPMAAHASDVRTSATGASASAVSASIARRAAP